MLAEAEEAHDMRMAELAERRDFRLEALAEVEFLGHGRKQQFDRRRFARLHVDGLVDGAHAAAADFPPDFVGPSRWIVMDCFPPPLPLY